MTYTRNILLLVSIFFAIAGTLGQDKETKIDKKKLPDAVLSAFTKAYPSATITGSSKEKENGRWTYEIESLDGKTKRDLAYAADGTIIETEETVDIASVPGDPTAAIAKLNPKAKITSIEKVVTKKGTEYAVHIAVGKKHSEVKFDAQGVQIPSAKEETKEGKRPDGKKTSTTKDKDTGKDKDDDDDSPRR